MQKYYLDTCIWRDFFEDRFGRSGNPLGSYAAKLLMRIISNKDSILYSDHVIFELRRDYEEEDIRDMLFVLILSNILIKVLISDDERMESMNLAKQRHIPLIDCTHAILARDNKAILVSQDEHIIRNLRDIAETKRPQDII